MSGNTLGIIAGSGTLPLQIIEACKLAGRNYFVLAFEEAPEAALNCDGPHAVVRLGAIGEVLGHLRGAGAVDLVLAGKVKRPSFSSLKPDKMGAKWLAHLGRKIFSGDDALLKGIVGLLEMEGFRVVGSDEVLAGLLATNGALGRIQPDAQAQEDIALGVKVASELGRLDIGQAVVVEHGYVLGVEAAEGTDALIARCSKLKRETHAGVLVKLRKRAQETRVDLPAIGAQTVEAMHAAGFAGIAIEAGGAIVLEKEAMIARADALGLFIVGVAHE